MSTSSEHIPSTIPPCETCPVRERCDSVRTIGKLMVALNNNTISDAEASVRDEEKAYTTESEAIADYWREVAALPDLDEEVRDAMYDILRTRQDRAYQQWQAWKGVFEGSAKLMGMANEGWRERIEAATAVSETLSTTGCAEGPTPKGPRILGALKGFRPTPSTPHELVCHSPHVSPEDLARIDGKEYEKG